MGADSAQPLFLSRHQLRAHKQVSRSVCLGLNVTAVDIALAVGLGAASHALLLAFNFLSVLLLRLGGPNRLEKARLRQALVLQVREEGHI